MSLAHYPTARGSVDTGPGPGGWDTFGVSFCSEARAVDDSDIMWLYSNQTLWSDNQEFTNAAGDTARAGWVLPLPTNSGTLNDPVRYYGYVQMNLGTEGVFRVGIAGDDQGSDYDVVMCNFALHSNYNCRGAAYTDGVTQIASYDVLQVNNQQRYHLNGLQYSLSDWLSAEANVGRFRATNVQQFIEFRFNSQIGTGNGSSSYARISSVRLYKV